MRQSGADDNMVMEATKAKYLKDMKHEFKLEHQWEAVRHHPKWANKGGDESDGSKRTRLTSTGEYSSAGSRASEEEISRPIGRDRAKAAARKNKGKATSSSDSTGMGDMLKNLCKVSKRFMKVSLWKQWGKLKQRPTEGMSEEEKKSHMRALKLMEKDLGFENETEVEEEEDEEDEIENSE